MDQIVTLLTKCWNNMGVTTVKWYQVVPVVTKQHYRFTSALWLWLWASANKGKTNSFSNAIYFYKKKYPTCNLILRFCHQKHALQLQLLKPLLLICVFQIKCRLCLSFFLQRTEGWWELLCNMVFNLACHNTTLYICKLVKRTKPWLERISFQDDSWSVGKCHLEA